ncbi:MAG: ExbD/TolR family protein [Pirellulaceae bacterium]
MGIKKAPSSSATTAVFVRGLALGFFAMFALALIFVLASLYVARTYAMHARAVTEQRRAIAAERAEMLFREKAEQARGQKRLERKRRDRGDAGDVEGRDAGAARRVISVALDAEGNVEAAGQASSLDQLRTLLQSAGVASDTSLAVILYVDPQCPFERVSRVQGLCHELGVGVTRIPSREVTGPTHASIATQS